jgi:putative ABC transport system permease protein
MGLKVVAGEGYTGAAADSNKFLLNEAAVRLSGIKDPIGKRFKLWEAEGIIAGVVKDFHNVSLRSAIEPTVLFYRDKQWMLYVKTSGKQASKAIAAVQKQWQRYNPNYPFTYQFMDQEFEQMYQTEQRTGRLFNVFASLAILISVLGLFGLATYMAQRRIKEIGIRKALGASVESIVAMLAQDFIRLVLLAFFLAAPLAGWLMNKWLQSFAYRVDLQWWHFALAGVIAVCIAFATISLQSIRAALSNPVKALRSE